MLAPPLLQTPNVSDLVHFHRDADTNIPVVLSLFIGARNTKTYFIPPTPPSFEIYLLLYTKSTIQGFKIETPY
jgi:hypothetical protein